MRRRTLILTILSALLAPAATFEPAEASAVVIEASTPSGEDNGQQRRHARVPIADPRAPHRVAKDPRLVAAVESLLRNDPRGAGATIAEILSTLSPAAQTHVVCLWALSPHRPLRLAVAKSARHLRRPPVGLPSAIERLTRDEDLDVRESSRGSIG